MFTLEMIAASTADTGGMHVVMLVLLLVAVALIVAGGVIAVFTLYNLRKEQTLSANVSELESELT